MLILKQFYLTERKIFCGHGARVLNFF